MFQHSTEKSGEVIARLFIFIFSIQADLENQGICMPHLGSFAGLLSDLVGCISEIK
jgi:hypothetical protein